MAGWALKEPTVWEAKSLSLSKFCSCAAHLLLRIFIIQEEEVFFMRALGRLASKWLQGKSVDSGVRDSIEKFIRYFVFLVGLMMALDNMGFSISSLAAVGAVLMVGIGFGLQNLTQNFISGIILLIERPIKVGDIIRVGATSGRIVDIRVRSTIVQTRPSQKKQTTPTMRIQIRQISQVP